MPARAAATATRRAASRATTATPMLAAAATRTARDRAPVPAAGTPWSRSEEHTSELQSQSKLVCRLLLEKKNVLDVRVGYDQLLVNGAQHDEPLEEPVSLRSRHGRPRHGAAHPTPPTTPSALPRALDLAR